MNNQKHGPSLSKSQVLWMIAFGVIGWFAAAMVVCFGGPFGLFEGLLRILLYIGIVILWLPCYQLIKSKLKLSQDQLVPAFAIGTSAAALCDGIAMPWASFLYGNSVQVAFYGAAWILWFVGIGLAMALIDSSR